MQEVLVGPVMNRVAGVGWQG